MNAAVLSVLALLAELVARLVVISVILIRARGRPQARLAWIVVILTVPLLGLVLYLLVGEVRLGHPRMKRHRAIVEQIERAEASLARRPQQIPLIEKAYLPLAHLAETVGDRPPRGGNLLQLFAETDAAVDALVADIDRAEHHCHLLFYIFLPDATGQRVAQALGRAAQRGVACRVLVDAVGSKSLLRSSLARQMHQDGVALLQALPVNPLRMLFSRIDVRNHRKIAVIDGQIGYLGSQNLADAAFAPKPRFAPWVDAMVRMEGPGTADLQVLFVEDWFLDSNESLEAVLAIEAKAQPDGVTVQIMGSGPSSYNAALRQQMQAAIHAAEEELILTTPYFVPDEATLTALRTTARRGVRTTIVVPRRNDSPIVAAASRSLYEGLMRSGVQIFEYNGGLLHAKTFTIDRKLALIGSANLDRRSFELNFEVAMLVYDTDFASQVRFAQQGYMSSSKQVDPEDWEERGWPRRLIENATGTLGPLL